MTMLTIVPPPFDGTEQEKAEWIRRAWQAFRRHLPDPHPAFQALYLWSSWQWLDEMRIELGLTQSLEELTGDRAPSAPPPLEQPQ